MFYYIILIKIKIQNNFHEELSDSKKKATLNSIRSKKKKKNPLMEPFHWKQDKDKGS